MILLVSCFLGAVIGTALVYFLAEVVNPLPEKPDTAIQGKCWCGERGDHFHVL